MRPAVTLTLLLALTSTASAQPRLPFPLRGAPRDPTPAEREFSAGDALLQRGDLAGALPRFEAARRLDPRDARPVFYLGEVAFRQSRFTDAEPLFREAIRLRPTMAEAHAELGATLRELDRCADAIPALREALRLQASLGEAHVTLGQCYEDQRDLARALPEYRAAMTSLRDDPSPALQLGLALASTNPPEGSPERAEAQRALREAMRRADRDPATLAQVGPALRRMGDPRSAVTALSRARTLATTPSPALLGELAQAHAAAGQWPLAEARLGEAIALRRDDPGLYYLRGLVRVNTRNRAGSIADLREAARLGGETPLGVRARERLRAMGVR